MKELLLKKAPVDDKIILSIINCISESMEYVLTQEGETLLAERFIVKSEDEIATIKMEHVLFTPAKMPKLTISIKNGSSFVIRKDIEQLSDVINVDGTNVYIVGNPFSREFELWCKDKRIARISKGSDGIRIDIEDEHYETIIVLFAFAVKLIN